MEKAVIKLRLILGCATLASADAAVRCCLQDYALAMAGMGSR